MPMKRRTLLVLAVSVAVVLSVVAVAVLLLQREVIEVRAMDVAMVADAPESGMTQLHASLVLKNVGPVPVHFAWITLFATDPGNGSLLDTFTHEDFQLQPGEARTFSEVTNITGHWSGVSLTLKMFPDRTPGWESVLVPGQPVTWTSW
jgi:hypothetical protein